MCSPRTKGVFTLANHDDESNVTYAESQDVSFPGRAIQQSPFVDAMTQSEIRVFFFFERDS